MEAKVDLEELIQEVSKHIGIQWKALARALGFVQTDIDAIEYDNLLNLKEQIHQLFHKWKQQEGIDATPSRLLDGIRKAGLDDLMKTLQEKEYVAVKPSSASLAASLAAGARATSGQHLVLSQQTQQASHETDGKKTSSPVPVVTSPVDAERERLRKKRLDHFLPNSSDSSRAHNINSSSSVPQASVEKDSTAKASNSQATAASQSSNEPFEVGDMIKVSWHGAPLYGVVKWLGKLELSGDLVRAAGVEMDEVVKGGHSGTFNGNQYFSCDDGHGLLLPVHKLERDDRFDSPAVPSSSPQRQTPLTETPVAQFHVGIDGSNSSNASSSQFSTPMSPQQQGANISSTTSAEESAFRRLLSDPTFTEAYNEMRGNESPMQQHCEPTSGMKLLVFYFPKDRGGLVVGREGKNIQEVERETNTSINIDRSYTGGNGKGTIIGSEENCKRALELILTNLEKRIFQRLATTETVIIPNQQMAGRVIGKGGRTREAIEKRSGAKLEIKKPEGIDYFLTEVQHCKITGSAEQIEEAKKLIDRAMLGADITGEATTAAFIVKLASHFRQMGFVFPDGVFD